MSPIITPDGIIKDRAWMSFVPTFSELTMFYSGTGNVLIAVEGGFTPQTDGCLLLELTVDGGVSWHPMNCEKVGRGMTVNATADGPARFRKPLDDGAYGAHGVRIRASKTFPMEPIPVSITFAGQVSHHFIRAEPEYVIQEAPDIRDFI